jgi:hypothetical protein
MNRACSFALVSSLLLLIIPVSAQQTENKGEDYFRTTFSVEAHDVKQGCQKTQPIIDANGKVVEEKKPLKVLVPGCLMPIFHGNKGLYGSFANLPPGNSDALGALFKDSELNPGRKKKDGTPSATPWRMDYQIDSQGSFNGSWTAGGFLTMRLSPTTEGKTSESHPESSATAQTSISASQPVPPSAPTNSTKPIVILHPPIVHQGPIKHLRELGETETKLLLNLYAFHTSLNQVSFFGIGPDTVPADRSFFAFRETVTGGSADVLLPFGFHLLGELNGRWPTVGGGHGQSSPSIEQAYTETTAPGLTQQPGFLQPGEGLEFNYHGGGIGKTAKIGADFNLDWTVNFQQFFAPSSSIYSFRRLTIDATNEFNLLRMFKPKLGSPTPEQFGTLTLRGWVAESIAPAGHVVPFYFQPTLGGGDIDKDRTLPSFADYRFRAPNALLFTGQYEWPLPKYSFLGLDFRADTGKVGNARGDIDLSHLRHSYGAGFTVRAGNFPYLVFMYAWGGGEGHHTFADVNLSAISSGGGATSLW